MRACLKKQNQGAGGTLRSLVATKMRKLSWILLGVLMREGERHKERDLADSRGDDVSMEVETRKMWPQVKESQQPPKPGRDKKQILSWDSRRTTRILVSKTGTE